MLTSVGCCSVAAVGFQHIIGTILGGSFALAILFVAKSHAIFAEAWWMTISTTLGVVISIVVFSWYMRIPDTSTMFILPCIILVFATEGYAKAKTFDETRVMGMIGGVILMQILAVSVYPKSATQEVRESLIQIL